ncbi:unnamed protein product [Rhizophagus irregularis]|nr:unnamed protein product [Rhizophagus irregularis]
MENDKKEEPETRSYASSSNNLPSDPEELTKVFEKKLEALENMVKLFKSDAEGLAISRSPGVRPTMYLFGRSTCEKQDIKHVRACGSSPNIPAKKKIRKARCPIRPRNLIRPRLLTSLTSFSLSLLSRRQSEPVV